MSTRFDLETFKTYQRTTKEDFFVIDTLRVSIQVYIETLTIVSRELNLQSLARWLGYNGFLSLICSQDRTLFSNALSLLWL